MKDVVQNSEVIAGTLLLNNVKAKVLIDSGATRSFISESFVDKLQCDKMIMSEVVNVLAAMVIFKQTARKTCDANAYVRAQQRAHSSSSSGTDDTIAFSVRNYEGKPKEQMTARLETLVQYVNTKLEEMPAHRDRTSQYVIQMVADELQSIVKTLREEKTTKPRLDVVEP
ncbi:hypothetical protein AgCh_013390 [Apium graveolens]